MAVIKVTLRDGIVLNDRPTVDRAKIDATTEEDIRRHMIEDGEDPDAPLPDTFRVVEPRRAWLPVQVREATGLSQVAFATAIGLPVKTWRNWEQGKTRIDPAGQALLRLLAADPRRGVEVLKAPHESLVGPDQGSEEGTTVIETDDAFINRMKTTKGMPTSQDVARMRRIEREDQGARFDAVLFKHRKPTRG